MKKFLQLSFIGIAMTLNVSAQLPAGSTAANWTYTDINGNTQSLYSYLDQGKYVIIDISATWCGPCWNYHNSGNLENLFDLYGPA
jgi:thiol-disulfide isomerase/thioredoxin